MTEDQNYIERKPALQQEKPVRTLSEDHGQVHDDSQFLSGLNIRMRNVDWSAFEQGAESFRDIEKDLKQLNSESPRQAAELWSINAPKGLQLPDYITEKLKTVDSPSERIIEGRQNAPEAAEEKYSVPDAIRKRYLEADGKFYFREATNKLAFEDRGARLHTEHNDPAVATSMVEIAAAKGWGSLKANGTEEFKREVWLQASLKNIDVTGFKPKDVDLAKLDELRSARMRNSIEPGIGREPTSVVKTLATSLKSIIDKATPGASIPDQFSGKPANHNADLAQLNDLRVQRDKVQSGPDPKKNPEQFSGKLLAHGEAHFDFDKQNGKSYFVKIETVNGSRIHWGGHLKELVANSPSAGKAGERIELLPKELQIQSNKSKLPAPSDKPELKGGFKVAAAVMADVLKEKGYSAKVLDKAVTEATRRLDQMKSGGDHAPVIKVYDKSAPREMVRERLKPSKSKQREAERNR